MSREAVVEAAAEATDVVFDTIEAVPEVVRNNPAVLASVAVVSALTGAGVAVIVTRKILQVKYEKLIAQEIQDAKQHYKKQFKLDEFSDPTTLAEGLPDAPEVELDPETEMVKEASRIMEKQQYVPYNKAVPETEEEPATTVNVAHADVVVTQNVFESQNDEGGFDLDDELAKKSSGKPYIIEAEQFLENEIENTQTTLTWYDGDKVLVDDREQALTNFKSVIGADNLKFGRGSKDPNVVYIRNDRFHADYEVVYSNQNYSEVVLGLGMPPTRTRRSARDED